MIHDKLIVQALNEWKNDDTLKKLSSDELIDLIIHRIQTFEYVKDLKYKRALQIVEGQIECENCETRKTN